MQIPPLAPDATSAPLVLDDEGQAVRLFRSTSHLPDGDGQETLGLAELRCSGSAQPSIAGFRDLKRRLGVRDDDLYVVDLRQESHGFVDDAAVSWYAASNWGAAGLSDAEALALEATRLRLLALGPVMRIASIDGVKGRAPPSVADRPRGVVASEEQACGCPKGRYVRLPVTDHTRPRDETVDRFLALVRGLDEAHGPRAHLHLHCRGGKGRTATFLCLLDMLQNAARLPLAVILERQAWFNGYDLRKAPDPTAPKAPFIAERQAFVARFYDYARQSQGGALLSWGAWCSAAGRPPER